MNEDLLQLLRLQEVDKELSSLEVAKDKYPAEIDTRCEELGQGRSVLQAKEEQLEELGRQQRHFEREMEDARVSLKEHEERFAEISTNKEYDALQLEIEADKAKISECETRILEAVEASEQLQEQIEIERQEFGEFEQEQQAHIEELQTRLASLQGEVDQVQEERQSVLGSIAGDLLKTYERSRKKMGTRVAPIRRGACGGCFRQLPAQQKSNVRRDEELYFCESCGTILVWDAESS